MHFQENVKVAKDNKTTQKLDKPQQLTVWVSS